MISRSLVMKASSLVLVAAVVLFIGMGIEHARLAPNDAAEEDTLVLIAESQDEIDEAKAANDHADMLTARFQKDQQDGMLPGPAVQPR